MADLLQHVQTAVGDTYRVDSELAVGGMSRLFLATEASLNRRVVIKVLPPELASEVSAARFKHEMELTAQLQHPHILPILSAGARSDLLYYVMPYVAGESLRHRLRRDGRFSIADAVRILGEVADALAYAHGEGVIHRDIKPENILLAGRHAVLADFGVARALVAARTGERLTESGVALGTPGYMAPEQAAGEQHVDARADVYALAVVGYEMLAGRPPFTGPTMQSVLAAHLTVSPARLADVRHEVPRSVSDAVAKALGKSPDERFQTAAAFRDALDVPPDHRRLREALRRHWAVGRWAAVGAAALVLAVAGAGLLGRTRKVSELDANVVAVAPFDVFAPELRLWREGMVDVLSANLDGAGPIRTVSPSVVIRRWSGRADAASAAELGRWTGARLVVYGRVLRAGNDSVRLTATVLDAADRKPLVDVERRELGGRMDRLVDSLTVALLRELGRTRPVGAVRLASLGSTSLPALKAFLQGEQYYRRAAWDSALVHYDQAVALDSAFTVALSRIARIHGWYRRGASRGPVWTAYALRAGALNRGLAPRESLLVLRDSLSPGMFRFDENPGWVHQVRRLLATLEEAARRYPNDPEVWFSLGEERSTVGRLLGYTDSQVLEAFDRAIALDSAFAPPYGRALELALLLKGPDLARRYVAAFLARHPKSEVAGAVGLVDRLLDPAGIRSRETRHVLDTAAVRTVEQAMWMLERWADSAETALRLARLRVARASADESGSARAALARHLGFRGHLRDVYAIYGSRAPWWFAELALVGTAPPDTAAAVFGRWLRNENWGVAAGGMLWTLPRPDRARPRAELALPWWASRGDVASLLEFLRRARLTERSASNPTERGYWRYNTAAAQGYVALARRDTAEALRRFGALADTLCLWCHYERLTHVQLLRASGRYREAAGLLERGLRSWPLQIPSEVLWSLERGRVAERLGDRAKAMEGYRYVADVWLYADPELQPFVAEAKRALKRLSGDRPRGVVLTLPR
ncbi:MAG: protein kinase [Gemmatimonadaceae bacterium]